jgi:hypothetical protein
MGLSDFFGWGTKDATFSTLENHLPHYLLGHLKVYSGIEPIFRHPQIILSYIYIIIYIGN